ncbi:MAG: hypothetical protein NT023_14290 [Armatimonadetes bacterium]|nr:hypothetical protein [Armatimonadota bacterium]
MAITIELQPEQEERIATEAKRRGLSVEDYLARAIAGDFPLPPPDMTPKAILEALKRDGVIPMWQDRPEDSVTLARKLRYPQERAE